MKSVLQIALGLLLLAALAYGAWLVVAALFAWTVGQSSEVVAAIIAFAGTVTGGVAAVVISQQWTNRRALAESHRPRKTELYLGFIDMVVGILRDQKGKKLDASREKQLEDFFFDFTTHVMLWGSPGVLKRYGAFRKAGQEQNPEVILLVDDILQAMRKDLGLGNRGLERGDLMKMLLTDPEKLDSLFTQSRGK